MSRARHVLGAVTRHIRRELVAHQQLTMSGEAVDYSIATGSAGLCMYFATVADDDDLEPASAAFLGLMRDVTRRAVAVPPDLQLASGTAGAHWALRYVARQGRRLVPCCADIPALGGDIGAAPSGLIDGLAGFAAYDACVPDVRSWQQEAVAVLATRAARQQDLLHWPDLLARAPAGGDYNMRHALGAAHGLAGVISGLCAFLASGIEPALTERLLHEGTESLVAYLRRGDIWSAAYTPARCSWSWGEAGIAMALHDAGVSCGRDDWKGLACHIAARLACVASPRHAPSLALGSGMAGTTLVLWRLSGLTADERIRDGLPRWVGGLLTNTETQLQRAAHGTPHSLLRGWAGIGLVINELLTPSQTAWARVLLPYDGAAARRTAHVQ